MQSKRFYLAALLLLLIAYPAQAQTTSRVWIAEFATSRPQAAAPFATLPALVRQPVMVLTGTPAKTSQPFNVQTKYIRIVCEAQCAISGAGVATTADILLPAKVPEYFGVSGGRTISVIAAP